MPRFLTPALVSTVLVAAAAPLIAQAPLKTLSKAEVEYSEPFTNLTGVRELRDGRVIAADAREKTVQLIDLKAGTATKIGREGSGPGEYALPMRLVGLPGDTSAVYDPLNRRFLLIGPDGKVGAFASYETQDNSPGRMRISVPRGVDARGRLYSVGPSYNLNPTTGASNSADSAPILRLDRATKKTDTVAFVHIPPVTVTTSGSSGNTNVAVRAGGGNPYAATDEWAVMPDGRVAVFRVKDYHVDWYAPNGQKTSGPPIAFEKIKVTDEDKKQYRERAASGAGMAISMSQRVGPGGTTSSATAGAPPNVRLPEPTDWPDVKPPFVGNAALGAPNGQVWLLRTRSAKDNIPTYDVFDATGKVVSRVALPVNTRLVGFGNGTVYLARSDEDDLQYLQRYRLP